MLSNNEIIKMRKTLIQRQFAHMNNMQQQAIFTVNGALLILAGAGSGKTTVLVNRISNILSWGNAYNSDYVPEYVTEKDIDQLQNCYFNNIEPTSELISKFAVNPAKPYQIMAITFTNKAAKELKERISAKLNCTDTDIWASTFHSSCAKILRRYADLLGYSSHFAIYDTDDSKRIIKDCCKSLGIIEREYPIKTMLNEISKAKNSGISLEDFKKDSIGDSYMTSIAKVFDLYQKSLKKSDAMDFDDLLINTVNLLKNNEEVRTYYQKLFKYVMVDEYQDTNKIQYELIRLLSDGTKNLCVVGDDDQSIYKFRGATIENIINFEENYPNAKVIRLEQNYRSTKVILSAANSVIENNTTRKGKNLWTNNDNGDLITVFTTFNETEEADYIGSQILSMVAKGKKYSDFAVLYRTNSQSRALERVFVRSAIPHKIIGSVKFYERKEVKDMLAYLRIVNNNNDDEKLKRIINYPKRAIGSATVSNVEEIASQLGKNMMSVLRTSNQYADLVKAAPKLMDFANMIDEFSEIANDKKVRISDLYITILERIDFKNTLKKDHSVSDNAIENVEELLTAIRQYENENGEDASLSGFLDEIALMTDIDNYNNNIAEDDNRVSLMTIHSAKGLEFPVVFLPGMEENLFPSFKSSKNPEDLQEERRLAYVALTRAKEKIFITNAQSRIYLGVTNRNSPSRFIKEIPAELITSSTQQPIVSEMSKAYAVSPYEKRKHQIETAKIFGPAVTEPKKSVSSNNYSVGDIVNHKAFGKGMIISSKPMGNDFLLEIAFDTAGTKKIMSNFSKLEKI